jgi:biopolymer transport protein ExbD
LKQRTTLRSWLRRARPRPQADVDLTSAIDVVFLLLIFFMVTSVMTSAPARTVRVPEARHGSGVDLRIATVIQVWEPDQAGGEPKIGLGDKVDRAAGVPFDEEAVRAFVEQGVRDGRPHIIIKAERKVPNRYVAEVQRTVVGVDGIKLFVAVQDPRPKSRRESESGG